MIEQFLEVQDDTEMQSLHMVAHNNGIWLLSTNLKQLATEMTHKS